MTTRRRVFLALWPDPATRTQLDRLARTLTGPGRPVPQAHLHLTLAFAGSVPAEQADCLATHIHALHHEPIALTLDRLGHFTRARVTWAGPGQPPGELAQLAQQARELCQHCGIELPPAPFRPHITLRRQALPPPHEALDPPVQWSADTVVLVESGQDGHPGPYRVIASTGMEHQPPSSPTP